MSTKATPTVDYAGSFNWLAQNAVRIEFNQGQTPACELTYRVSGEKRHISGSNLPDLIQRAQMDDEAQAARR